jgi:hypothetical protein
LLIAAGETLRGLRFSPRVFHSPSSSTACAHGRGSSATSETTLRAIRVTGRSDSLPLWSPQSNPAGAAGQVGPFRSPLVEGQIQVPAEGIC